MEFKHIYYFISVAEQGNISHAAETMGMAQPILSLKIKALEKDLDVKLFKRISKGVELTEAGEVFYEKVKNIPNILQEATLSAKCAARGEIGKVIIGFTTSLIYLPEVYQSLLFFKRDNPQIKLTTIEQNSIQLEESLKGNKVDLIFSREDHLQFSSDFKSKVIYQEELILVLSKSHPLASTFKSLMQLKNDKLILFPQTHGYALLNNIYSLCRDAGFEPKSGIVLPQLSSIIHAVAANLGYALVPASMSHLNFPDVVFIQLNNEIKKNNLTSVIIRRNEKSKIVKKYLSLFDNK